jgi:hypothetical protein
MKNQFKSFLLTEEKIYLGQRLGDILTALQQLNDDAANMGKRHLIRIITNITSQIRRILHGSWTYEEEKYLKQLQKIGVALMKGIDSNEDLIQVISNCTAALEKLSDDLDTPVNNLASPAHSDFSYDDDHNDDD